MSRRDRRGADHCPLDGYPLRDRTDGRGHVLTTCQGCDRRRAGQCMDCARPVGTGWPHPWRCAPCRRAAKRRQWNEHGERCRADRNRRARRRYRKQPAAKRTAALERKRKWRRDHPARVKLSKRNGRLTGTWGYTSREKYLAAQAYQNSLRVESKRAHARAAYYRKHPTRPAPRCTCCDQPIPWTPGNGRPPKWLPGHAPWHRKAA